MPRNTGSPPSEYRKVMSWASITVLQGTGAEPQPHAGQRGLRRGAKQRRTLPPRNARLAGAGAGFLRGGPAGDLLLSARPLLGGGLVAQSTKVRLERRQPGALLEDLQSPAGRRQPSFPVPWSGRPSLPRRL